MSNYIGIDLSTKNTRANLWIAKFNSGKLILYDGTQPATPDDAITTQNQLVSFDIPATSGSVTDNIFTGVSLGSSLITTAGTCTWGRIYNSGDDPIADFSVGTPGSGAGMIIDNIYLIQGALVTIDTWVITE